MTNKVLVWDLPVRVFHWLLVLAFAIACLSEDDALTLHVRSGYLIGVLLLFRIVWGFFGTRYARFADFLCQPRIAPDYLKAVLAFKAKRYLGHNPAGAWMILLLLIALLLTTLSGLAVYAADQNAGPLAGWIGFDYEKVWEEAHEFFANLTLFLVIVHVSGVLLESFVQKENPIGSMWQGYKNAADDDTEDCACVC